MPTTTGNALLGRTATPILFRFITVITSFKDARNLLLESYNDGIIDEDEFILLYEGNFLKNPEFPYKYNERFGLDAMDGTIQFKLTLVL